MVDAIDEAISTRPSPRAVMSRSTSLARCTVDPTLRSITSNSSARSMSRNAPPRPMPALSAAASSGRPSADSLAPQVLDAVGRAQVGAHLVHGRAGGAQVGGRGGQLGVLGGDDDVEVVGGELSGQLEADPAGRARHQGRGCGSSCRRPAPGRRRSHGSATDGEDDGTQR